uniref:Uncharacterized protein n=1 Tax=Glossina palpalis gambiensis TaxID=67801 RepID=A0A1B0B4G3_9MUSC
MPVKRICRGDSKGSDNNLLRVKNSATNCNTTRRFSTATSSPNDFYQGKLNAYLNITNRNVWRNNGKATISRRKPNVTNSTCGNYIMICCNLAAADHISRAAIDLHSFYCLPTMYNNQQTEQIELKIVADFQEASSNSVVAVAFQGCLTKRLGIGERDGKRSRG